MASSAAAQLLDELMGRNRNLAPTEKGREIRWDDSEVCKYFLCGFCPHELFTNTRADLGPCDKVHDEELRKNYQKSSRFERMGYEEDFLRFLQSLLSDVERRIKRGHARLALNAGMMGGPTTLTPNKDEEVEILTKKINDLVQEAEELGCEGKVEEAQGVMKLCEQLQEEREQLDMRATKGLASTLIKEMEVCQVCGAFLVVGDAQQRHEEHLMGRQHVGYARLRATKEELEKKLYGEEMDREEKLAKEREEREKEREREREERRKREEEREKEREERRRREREKEEKRRRSRSHSRSHRSRSRSRSRRNRRSRSRDRRRRTRSRDRSRDRRRRNSRTRSRDRSRRTSREQSRRSRSRSRDRRDRDRRDRDRRRSRDRDERRSGDKDRRSRDKDRDDRKSREHDKESRRSHERNGEDQKDQQSHEKDPELNQSGEDKETDKTSIHPERKENVGDHVEQAEKMDVQEENYKDPYSSLQPAGGPEGDHIEHSENNKMHHQSMEDSEVTPNLYESAEHGGDDTQGEPN